MAVESDVRVRGRLDLVFVLLCLQAGIGVLSALGEALFALAARSPGVLGAGFLLALLLPAAELLCAFGVQRLRRWGLFGCLSIETVLLLSTALRLALRAAPVLGLAGLLVTLLLPLSIAGLLLTPSVRRAFSANRRAGAVPSAAPQHRAA